jgi:hypothetical protein
LYLVTETSEPIKENDKTDIADYRNVQRRTEGRIPNGRPLIIWENI